MSHIAFWNSFHDGTLDYVSGTVPGEVILDVSIDYLRRRFPGAGTSFRVTLLECTQFEYEPYDEQAVMDLPEISKHQPMVLSVGSEEPLVVDCVVGTLRLAYRTCRIATDAGQSVSTDQLKQASVDYWAEWSAKHRGKT